MAPSSNEKPPAWKPKRVLYILQVPVSVEEVVSPSQVKETQLISASMHAVLHDASVKESDSSEYDGTFGRQLGVDLQTVGS
mmetsp:Transcript_53813/g.86079  ORF Transcript_53813/g.86079 Transcript_53813/m.86079 type:complete len:81 (+) Transcript_53813:490-732(+)